MNRTISKLLRLPGALVAMVVDVYLAWRCSRSLREITARIDAKVIDFAVYRRRKAEQGTQKSGGRR